MEEASECGLGAFAVGIMLLTHEDRLQNMDDLWIDCAGDEFQGEYSPEGDFDYAPCFDFGVDGRLGFSAGWSDYVIDHCGSASGFLVPQS